MASRPWTRDETLVAFNLYCRTPFGRLHARNPDIIEAAECLGRTPSALAMKCCNLAAFDPALKDRGISGLSKTSRLDREIWDEFTADAERVGFESEVATARVRAAPLQMSSTVEWETLEGLDREAVTKVRVNQSLFRSIIVAGYRCECCVCTLPIPSMLVAAHIVPWSVDRAHRMNPRNGLCLCVLHDRAYDRGLFDVSADYVIRMRPAMHKYDGNAIVRDTLSRFDGQRISLPDRWHPDTMLLERHTLLFRDAMI